MPPTTRPLIPHKPISRERNIRQAHIQNLTNLLHVCFLKGDQERAARAWAILVRCREVDWKSKWQWGLKVHEEASRRAESSTTGAFREDAFREREMWLRTLMVRGKEEERPSLLHALILHYIQAEQYREALDELELYLPSYPYHRSAPLHTYAGLLCYWQAQPLAAKTILSTTSTNTQSRRTSSFSDSDEDTRPMELPPLPPADVAGVRAARSWFLKAVKLDKHDKVAKSFIEMIDGPVDSEDDDPPDPPPIPASMDRQSDIGHFSPTPRQDAPRTPSTEGIDDYSSSESEDLDDYSDAMSIG